MKPDTRQFSSYVLDVDHVSTLTVSLQHNSFNRNHSLVKQRRQFRGNVTRNMSNLGMSNILDLDCIATRQRERYVTYPKQHSPIVRVTRLPYKHDLFACSHQACFSQVQDEKYAKNIAATYLCSIGHQQSCSSARSKLLHRYPPEYAYFSGRVSESDWMAVEILEGKVERKTTALRRLVSSHPRPTSSSFASGQSRPYD